MGNHRMIGAGILTLSLFLNLVCLFTPGWLYDAGGEFNGIQVAGGLSKGLFLQFAGNATSNVRLESTELVLLIFSLVGDIVLVTAVIASVYGHAQNAKGFLGKLGGYLGVIGALHILVGLICFTIKWEQESVKKLRASWGYSYAFAWFSWCLAAIGSVISYGMHSMANAAR